jgi:AsmA family protein
VSTSPDTENRAPQQGPNDPPRRVRRRWPWVLGVIALALVLVVALFDWNMLRGPAERMASRNLGRDVQIGHLDVQLRGLTPRVVLTDVTVANADWAGPEPMLRAREFSFRVRLTTLFGDRIVLPHVGLREGEARLVRDADGRANWVFRDPEDEQERGLDVRSLSFDNAQIAYRDALHEVEADIRAEPLQDGPYATRVEFVGSWREGGPFKGTADTGSVLSLHDSAEPFPVRLTASAGKTSVQAEGEIADITKLSHIDADFAIKGPSLSDLYRTLRVALPDTPPYDLRGRLRLKGDTYTYSEFKGTIGKSDVAGEATYELREPRPMLTMELKSQRLNLADLGPVVGTDREPGERVLPRADFEAEKLTAMDADVRLSAARLQVQAKVPFEDFEVHALLNDGVLRLEPLRFGFAGGNINGTVVLDASQDPLAGKANLDLQRLQLARLMPEVDPAKLSTGSLGGQVRLTGRGSSVAALLGSANGSITAAMSGGRVSELGVWLVALHGGELIPLLFGGDRPTEIRCAAAAFDVKGGVAHVDTFVFDTDEVLIGGEGSVNLREERLDLTLHPEPKKPGILSLRGPVHITGTFSDPDFGVSGQTIARGVGAAALALINPLLALIPMIETGPGEDVHCRRVLQSVGGAVQPVRPPDHRRAA